MLHMENLEFNLLQENDRDIPILMKLHKELSIEKYISISENYFEYVVSTENVWYYKIISENVIIGSVHLEKDNDTMYLSICIHPQYQAKGYGKRCLKYIIGKLICGVRSIKVSIDEDNISSIRLFEGLGFIFIDKEGTLRNYERINFTTITACGECCVGCKKKESGFCKGCIESDGHCEEWAQSKGCPIYKCAKEHSVQFCGLCSEFPCTWLKEKITWNPNIVEHLTGLADLYYKEKK